MIFIQLLTTQYNTIQQNTMNEQLLQDIKWQYESTKKINICQKGLTEVPEQIYTLYNLQELGLIFNKITSLSEKIGNLSNLYELSLCSNLLTEIPIQVCHLKKLCRINLYGNKLLSLPKQINQLTNLRDIDLTGNNFVSPTNTFEQICHIKSLVSISFCSNKLTHIPKQISNLINLKFMILHYNKLTSLPTELWFLPNLQYLSMSNNKITSLPEQICNLTSLLSIDLDNNELACLPEEICDLVNLENLNLNHNKLSSLPQQLHGLKNLKNLRLWDNKLTTLPLSIIYIPNLCVTYANNEITNLHPAIVRWLNRSKSSQNIYSNKQSVHDHNIEATTNESIMKFVMSCNVPNPDINIIDDLEMSDGTKTLLKDYCNSDYVHSVLHLTFKEVLMPVLNYIINHENKKDLIGIMEEEMSESADKCFQGRLSRLINVLNGYHQAVNIKISDNEQISNVITMLMSKMKNESFDEFSKELRRELEERSYDENVINEWIIHAKDNIY